MKTSIITSILGFVAIIIGLWCCHVRWVHAQSFYFNMVYAVAPNIGTIFAGWIGLHAADHRAVKKHFKKHNLG